MIKALLIVSLAAVSIPAAAQTGSLGTITNPGVGLSWQMMAAELRQAHGADETPTMRATKLRRARALHVEAAALLEQDGGAFTPEHEAYIRRKACDILGPSPRRGC